jgi:outer membrane receptor protein involved in Fe transport
LADQNTRTRVTSLDSFFTFDLTLGWSIEPFRPWESLSFQPKVAIYNLFNRQNFDRRARR